jgi:Lon protease-like protein
MIQKLSLFPLNTVLFPGMPITLHIFEERYRLMIGKCLEQSTPFGVVLIREGSDTNPDSIPFAVGTTAQIGDSVRMEDGRYYLVATGQRRFRIQYIVQRQPFIVGSVSYLPEESGAAVVEPASQLRTAYTRYWNALAAATGYRQQAEAPPDDVIELTYWMAHRLKVSNLQKQRWLEADVATRLREMIATIRSELTLLPDADPNEREQGWGGLGSWN